MNKSLWVRTEADIGSIAYFVWRQYSLGCNEWPRLILGVMQTADGCRLEAVQMTHPDLRTPVAVPVQLLGEAATLLHAAANRYERGQANGWGH